MVLSPWNMLDFFAFFPPLLELWVNHSIRISFSMGHFDFRWFKILRWAALHVLWKVPFKLTSCTADSPCLPATWTTCSEHLLHTRPPQRCCLVHKRACLPCTALLLGKPASSGALKHGWPA